jgi:hypothetical protein
MRLNGGLDLDSFLGLSVFPDASRPSPRACAEFPPAMGARHIGTSDDVVLVPTIAEKLPLYGAAVILRKLQLGTPAKH